MSYQSHSLFSFPSIRVFPFSAPPTNNPPPVGYLSLSSAVVENDFKQIDVFLRLEFTPDFPSPQYPPIDVLLEAWRDAYRLDTSTFVVDSSVGQLKIQFPPLQTAIPSDDDRIDIPKDVRASIKWADVAEEFEMEFRRWTTYRQVEDGQLSLKKDHIPAAVGGAAAAYADPPKYNPADYANGSAPAAASGRGRLVLVDEEDGSEIGEIGGYQMQLSGIHAGSKDPVEIVLPENSSQPVTVRPAPEGYLTDALSPGYANSTIVSTAATASRLIVTTSSMIANALQSGAEQFSKRTAPVAAPLTFSPSTHNRVHQIHTLSTKAATFSAATIGKITNHAQNVGAKLAGKNADRPSRGQDPNPGLLNKSLIAFSTIADGIDYASKSLIGSSATAATAVVHHRYGAEAGEVARGVTGSVKNVALVYVDASGVSRRAIVRGVAKGMVVGKVRGGGEVIVPDDSINQNAYGLPGNFWPGPSGPSSPNPLSPNPGYSSNGIGSGPQGNGGMYFPPQPTRSPVLGANFTGGAEGEKDMEKRNLWGGYRY
ncbi:hypothetical protein RUND412_011296 [Rhizina undulata]